ncbi:MAG: acyl carrier protein [Clostridiales bacterium]|nr:MAG: acyl carrier protein [Clostridiales bacterium]
MSFEAVKEIIINNLGIEGETISLESHLQDDLGIDSLDAVELAMEIEEVTGVKIPDEDFANMKTVGDIVNYQA